MLLENVRHRQTQVQLVAYTGSVNPEHLNQMNCVPWVMNNGIEEEEINLEQSFIEDFLRKSSEFSRNESMNYLPIEIRLGTVYTYQNRRQQQTYPNSLKDRCVSADFLRHEEYRVHHEKHFLITFNKNKGINDLQRFHYELTCTGFRLIPESQLTYRLYLRWENRRVILELKRDLSNPNSFSVKRILKYTTKFRHIDVVKCKSHSNYPNTFDDIFDIRTTIGKPSDEEEEEELHINDEYCQFLQIKNLHRCLYEEISPEGFSIYHFNEDLIPFFDFFQIKQTQIYHYSCIDSQFFGLKIFLEQQIGYDLNRHRTQTTTPCLQTHNVITAKLHAQNCSEDEGKRIWTIGAWLSDLARRCTNRSLPTNQMFSRRPKHVKNYRRTVR